MQYYRIRSSPNESLGIDIAGDAVTLNDKKDKDKGANKRQSFPELTVASTGAGSTTLAGSLRSLPRATYVIQFFANAACHPTGFGQRETFLRSLTVATDKAERQRSIWCCRSKLPAAYRLGDQRRQQQVGVLAL
jgi:hypothetical protein